MQPTAVLRILNPITLTPIAPDMRFTLDESFRVNLSLEAVRVRLAHLLLSPFKIEIRLAETETRLLVTTATAQADVAVNSATVNFGQLDAVFSEVMHGLNAAKRRGGAVLQMTSPTGPVDGADPLVPGDIVHGRLLIEDLDRGATDPDRVLFRDDAIAVAVPASGAQSLQTSLGEIEAAIAAHYSGPISVTVLPHKLGEQVVVDADLRRAILVTPRTSAVGAAAALALIGRTLARRTSDLLASK